MGPSTTFIAFILIIAGCITALPVNSGYVPSYTREELKLDVLTSPAVYRKTTVLYARAGDKKISSPTQTSGKFGLSGKDINELILRLQEVKQEQDKREQDKGEEQELPGRLWNMFKKY